MAISSFTKEQWEKAIAKSGVMIRITIRHYDGYAMEVDGVFEMGGAQHDTCASAQRILFRSTEKK